MTPRIQSLADTLAKELGDKALELVVALDEVTLVVDVKALSGVMRTLRDHPGLRFAMLIDVCGVDYLRFANNEPAPGRRFAAVYHLLSLEHNVRLRVRTFADD